MNSTAKRLIWIPAVLFTNAMVWFAFQDLSPLALLATSIVASLVLREIVGTLFYYADRRQTESSDTITTQLDQPSRLFDDHHVD